MILKDIKELETSTRTLRKFGLLVGGIFAGLGLLFWLRHKPVWIWLAVPGAALVILGAAIPRALKHVYLAWMSLAIVLGFVVSNIILTLFFFLVVTPIGLVARLFGRDFLSRKWENKDTYWIARAPRPTGDSKSKYEQQF